MNYFEKYVLFVEAFQVPLQKSENEVEVDWNLIITLSASLILPSAVPGTEESSPETDIMVPSRSCTVKNRRN